MPPPIAALSAEMLRNPVTIQMQRQAAPASGITQAVYPVPQELKPVLVVHLLTRGTMTQALIFTRTKHRANRLADFLVRSGIKTERIHGNRSQAQRTAALAGFRSGTYPVLVATDIAARGIDVEALGHVVNFDVPMAPDDYIHRVGRTGRAEMTGEAFTLVSPQEEGELRDIEKVLGRRLPRVTVPDFDYAARPQAKLEIPLAQRIAEIRARKRGERERAAANSARRSAAQRGRPVAPIAAAGRGRPASAPAIPPAGSRTVVRAAAGADDRPSSSSQRKPASCPSLIVTLSRVTDWRPDHVHTMLHRDDYDNFESSSTDPAVALALLGAACRQLEQLARFSLAGSTRQYHRAVSVVHDICDALTDCEAAGVPDAEIRDVLKTAREIHGASPFVTRLQQWPRGYPGDFETIEWLWRGRQPCPGRARSRTPSRPTRSTPPSRSSIATRSASRPPACCRRWPPRGPAASCRSGAAAAPTCERSSIRCRSSATLRPLRQRQGCLVLLTRQARSDRRSAATSSTAWSRRVLRRVRDYGPFDLILAGGLFDYLSDRFIARTLSDAWGTLLAPGGRIVFTNIACGNPFRVWIEYMADWRLIERSEEDIATICREAGIPVAPTMVRDATSLAIVATLRKSAG